MKLIEEKMNKNRTMSHLSISMLLSIEGTFFWDEC